MLLLTVITLLAPAQAGPSDTTFAVAPGTRLRIEVMNGDIGVRVWDRNQMQVRVNHARRDEVRIRQSGTVISIETSGPFGPSPRADYDLRVPVWMAQTLSSLNGDITVDGVRAPVEITTLNGDITVAGGAESVKLSSTSGAVRLTGARGRIELTTTSEDIAASDIQGDLLVESISGDVTLRNVESKSVEAGTVSGSIWYAGTIQDGGRYAFTAHSGDIVVGVAESVNATVTVSMVTGELTAGFPLPAPERAARRRQTFRLGTGSAAVELETFSGEIRLLRPAALAARLDRRSGTRPD
jgi:DUF4097 and DUF4098 domain-containing protein YvlB